MTWDKTVLKTLRTSLYWFRLCPDSLHFKQYFMYIEKSYILI